MERWAPVNGYENYEVSDSGNIRNKYTDKILSSKYDRGYERVTLYNKGTRNMKQVHRLVAEAFINNPENKREVNHKDGNKENNNVENLEWVTSSENQIHKHEILGKTRTSNKRIGKFDKDTNELLEEFDSILDAVHSMGRTSRVSIDQVLQGRHKYAYGFSWKYLD